MKRTPPKRAIKTIPKKRKTYMLVKDSPILNAITQGMFKEKLAIPKGYKLVEVERCDTCSFCASLSL